MTKAESNKKYYKKNKATILKYRAKWYQKNKKKNDDYRKKWYQKNLEKNREQRRNANNRARLIVIEFLGNKCKKCGFDDWRALQVDHVNGGGTRERINMSHTSWSLLKRIKANPFKFQLLCANCNWIKRYEEKESFWHGK